MNNLRLVVVIIFFTGTMLVSAQTIDYAATVQIIGDEVYFLRANTQEEFRLPLGALAPFGVNDTIRTGDNGRVLITITENQSILLLPNSSYSIETFGTDTDNNLSFTGELIGIAVHQFIPSDLSAHYSLSASNFSITADIGHFNIWSVENGLQAITSASGELVVQYNSQNYIVPASSGFAIPYSDEAIDLDSPLHASQLVGIAVGCQGTVATSGSAGLRLRAGAALDYGVVDILRDGQQVDIVGTTENGLWYRIPFQTGFGWIFSSLIDADCNNLAEFPNLIGERPERIDDASEEEIMFLEPFYGLPENNTTFYR